MMTAGLLAATVVLAGVAGWCATALWFQAPGGARGRQLARRAVAAGQPAGGGRRCGAGTRGRRSAAFALAYAGVLWWWRSLKPSNERQWADDVAQTSHGEVQRR